MRPRPPRTDAQGEKPLPATLAWYRYRYLVPPAFLITTMALTGCETTGPRAEPTAAPSPSRAYAYCSQDKPGSRADELVCTPFNWASRHAENTAYREHQPLSEDARRTGAPVVAALRPVLERMSHQPPTNDADLRAALAAAVHPHQVAEAYTNTTPPDSGFLVVAVPAGCVEGDYQPGAFHIHLLGPINDGGCLSAQ